MEIQRGAMVTEIQWHSCTRTKIICGALYSFLLSQPHSDEENLIAFPEMAPLEQGSRNQDNPAIRTEYQG